ncbi:fumarylacetoacetate hydrolase family protein [Marivita geojedonensis]|uniref:2-hydroxyhepta-2,4-diene-1,7-dioate isomerase n=1 Tax=Marivita geojedonensis TaxID=1123756 RepID=A0A1X4NM83_9RHOB|nr:fumarylacetoacetate hydrolase family protein [Marivita geojedonensis]OSQ51473.1 2-hydroxyhepta-2,4-diene-1,7-dioate isomerase [Marivita geojedonensis]PRY77847.1 2,4-diketo-3-deoxy-L-fuconate hydrolase [Marivita geojedonensis]
MKLLRFGDTGAEKPGLMDDTGQIRDLSGQIDDITGDTLSPASLERLRGIDPASLPAVEGAPRIGPCVGSVGKVIAIGLNYADHAAEANMALPEEPIVFFKATSSISGPNDPVEIPRGSSKTDWEIELGVVIGTRAKYVSEADALSHVAGYCIFNDVSERDFQLHRSGQWVKGKSHDTFAPMGPWLVTADAVADPQNLAMSLSVNGQTMQDGSTRTMHFSVATVIAHLSQFMTLNPGDVIATGTPPGVGMGQKPQVYLREGDEMVLSIEGLGEQRQTCIAARD